MVAFLRQARLSIVPPTPTVMRRHHRALSHIVPLFTADNHLLCMLLSLCSAIIVSTALSVH